MGVLGKPSRDNACGFVTTTAYEKLRAENAKLREQEASIIGRSLRTADKMSCIEVENAKLRDAVAVLWKCCAWETDSVGWCDGCDYHDEDNGGCKVERMLHEFGIEVE